MLRPLLPLVALLVGGCEDTCPAGQGLDPTGVCAPLVFGEGDDTDALGEVSETTFVGNVSLYEAEAVARFCHDWDRVFGDVLVAGPGITDDVTLGCLREIRGALTVERTAWTRWHLPSLERVGQRLAVKDNAALASFGGDAPLTVAGELALSANPALTDLDLDRVVLQGGLSLVDVDALTRVVLAQEQPIAGPLTLTGNDALEVLDLSGVAYQATQVRLSSLPRLADLDVSGLSGSLAYLYVVDLPLVTGLDLSRLDGALDSATFSSVPALGRLDLSGVKRLGAFSVDSSTDGLTLDLSSLAELTAGFALPRGLGALTLGPVQAVAGDLVVRGTRLEDLEDLAGLRTIGGHLIVQDNGGLTSVAPLQGLEWVAGDVRILQNRSLPEVEAWALVDALGAEGVGGTVAVAGNAP